MSYLEPGTVVTPTYDETARGRVCEPHPDRPGLIVVDWIDRETGETTGWSYEDRANLMTFQRGHFTGEPSWQHPDGRAVIIFD